MAATDPNRFEKRRGPIFALYRDDGKRLLFRPPRWQGAIAGSVISMVTLAFAWGYYRSEAYRFDWDPDGYVVTVFMIIAAGFGIWFALHALAQRGSLVIDTQARELRIDRHSPGRPGQQSIQSFAELVCIRLKQVTDEHGLANHWRIELVDADGTVTWLGYGPWGAIRRASAEFLAQRVSQAVGVPVKVITEPRRLSR